jgi:hypothetical protein
MSTRFTVPTSEQIGAAMRVAAYRIAVAVAIFITVAHFVYQAGLATGRAVHRANDWLARAIHNPAAAAGAALAWADRILSEPEPAAVPILTGAQLVELWGAEILPDEPAKPAPRKRPAARRKPAGARKAQVAG